ncbi:hypothetical protein FF011L_52590 [Roseimaritima multifibrata]|uniref:Uncharacterized protein n=1 Tax=Roseimaritima multifibrata TaxID=1930274 RepID=A0A517MNI0_9BACT|nr:hypothetical protein FF011L_52590 [Roseimaritima multifibrata]
MYDSKACFGGEGLGERGRQRWARRGIIASNPRRSPRLRCKIAAWKSPPLPQRLSPKQAPLNQTKRQRSCNELAEISSATKSSLRGEGSQTFFIYETYVSRERTLPQSYFPGRKATIFFRFRLNQQAASCRSINRAHLPVGLRRSVRNTARKMPGSLTFGISSQWNSSSVIRYCSRGALNSLAHGFVTAQPSDGVGSPNAV